MQPGWALRHQPVAAGVAAHEPALTRSSSSMVGEPLLDQDVVGIPVGGLESLNQSFYAPSLTMLQASPGIPLLATAPP